MKIYQCDFCKETKPCTQTFIDSKRYDICAACRDKRDEELKNCGEQAIQYWHGGYVTNYIYYTPTITVPYFQPAPTWQPAPVITWGGNNTNTYSQQSQITLTGSSSCQV